MNLLHLQYFYTVAQEQGFTKAAKALRIQQPAISRMVRQLEDNLGFPLLERNGRRVQLTPQGQDVFEHCRKIFGSVEDLQQSLGRIGGECKGPLPLAAAEPIASHFLPGHLKDLMELHPEVHPQIFSGPASSLFAQILEGTLEFGLFFHVPEMPDRLELFRNLPVPFHLVIRKDLRRRADVIESFIGSREIDDVSTRRFPTLEKLRREHPRAKIRISSNNLTAHRELVLAGMGVSILPHFLVEDDLREGRFAELLPRETFQFQMKMVKRKSGVLSSPAKELLRLLSERDHLKLPS